jgi:hypothetical protein
VSFLDGAYARLDRARKHLADLEVREKAILHPQIEDIVAKTDLNTVKDFAITDPLAELPQSFSILIGETIYNLRAALDYLVFDLAILDSGVPQKGTQFPIDDTPDSFANHRSRLLKGLSVEHIARIEALQPYKGYNYTTMIRDISNPDKHRKLTLIEGKGVYSIKVVKTSEHQTDPKTGIVTVYRMEMKSEFVGHVAFKDDEAPIMSTLQILQEEVSKILGDFKVENS